MCRTKKTLLSANVMINYCHVWIRHRYCQPHHYQRPTSKHRQQRRRYSHLASYRLNYLILLYKKPLIIYDSYLSRSPHIHSHIYIYIYTYTLQIKERMREKKKTNELKKYQSFFCWSRFVAFFLFARHFGALYCYIQCAQKLFR